jgi:hypothetical protein
VKLSFEAPANFFIGRRHDDVLQRHSFLALMIFPLCIVSEISFGLCRVTLWHPLEQNIPST